MADIIPGLPPGISPAVALGRPITAEDISSNNTTLPSRVEDASSLIGAKGDLVKQLGISIGDMNAARNYGVTGGAGVAAGAQGVAAGTIAGTTADLATIMNQQANIAEVQGRFGTTPGHPSDLRMMLSSSIQSEALDVHNQRQAINAKLSQGFLDNPVQWLINQVTVPFDLDTLRSKRAGMDQDLEVLHELDRRTQEEVTNIAASTFSLSSGKAAALSQVALGQATQIAGEAGMRVGGILTGVAGVGDKFAGTEFTAAATLLHTEVAIDENSYKKVVTLQASALAQEEGKFRLEILNSQSTDLNKKMVADAALDARVDKLNNLAGTKFTNFKELAALPDGREKTALLGLVLDPNFQQGNALSLIGPSEAVQLVNKFNLPLNGPGEQLLRQKLTQAESAFINANRTLWKTYPPEVQNVMLNNELKTLTQNELKDIQSTKGYYSPPSLATTLLLPGIAGTKLSTMLLPLAQNKDGTPTPYATEAKDVIAAAGNLISTGKATPAEMGKEVANFYSFLAINGDTSHGYRKFALPSPLSTRTWNSSIPNESSFTLSPYATHNLMNAAEMETYFTRLQIQNLRSQAGGVAP